MTGVIESHSLRLEEIDKEHTGRTRELREQNLELSARMETFKDTLDGEIRGKEGGVWGRGPRVLGIPSCAGITPVMLS